MEDNEKRGFYADPLLDFMEKPKSEFCLDDILKIIDQFEIGIINFLYNGWDGHLKTVNVPVTNKEQITEILVQGERIDGSSIFPFISSGDSDLYICPVYETAFLNPFSEESILCLFCTFFDKRGNFFEGAPDVMLKKAMKLLKAVHGIDVEALGELEFYFTREVDLEESSKFLLKHDKHYHESSPFSNSQEIREEALRLAARCGCNLKYAHAEVGCFEKRNGSKVKKELWEQHELEFELTDPLTAAYQITIAKWILRMLAKENNLGVTFLPKVNMAAAGSGMHYHLALKKNGKNILSNEGLTPDGNPILTEEAFKTIGGILKLCKSMMAFGNPMPMSFLRLMPNMEAPVYICWGYRNRSSMIRIPLGWSFDTNDPLASKLNPGEFKDYGGLLRRTTIEYRAPDPSSNPFLILTAVIVAINHGLTTKEIMDYTNHVRVEGNIFSDKNKDVLKGLEKLPGSCAETAAALDVDREIYVKDRIFTNDFLNFHIKYLEQFDDKTFNAKILGKELSVDELVTRYFDWG